MPRLATNYKECDRKFSLDIITGARDYNIISFGREISASRRVDAVSTQTKRNEVYSILLCVLFAVFT